MRLRLPTTGRRRLSETERSPSASTRVPRGSGPAETGPRRLFGPPRSWLPVFDRGTARGRRLARRIDDGAPERRSAPVARSLDREGRRSSAAVAYLKPAKPGLYFCDAQIERAIRSGVTRDGAEGLVLNGWR